MAADSNKRILVADDDVHLRELVAARLRQRSLTVDEAASGTEAIALLRENKYTVVLLDLIMPDGDGFSVLEELAREEVRVAPVVLVLTGADRQTIARLDANRIHGVVRKPFDIDELVSLVVACSEVKSRGALETMAIAMISSAPILDLLRRFS
ncbi:MAG: response regulator [Thermoanaerobaculia bacterium]|nr:response regulator [Thermoanaerobaculia bacterium]